MFTGLVSEVGRVVAVAQGRDARAFTLATRWAPQSIALGASIAHDGCCLTVVRVDPSEVMGSGGSTHVVEVSEETLSLTTLGGWREGRAVNLERSLRVGDELGGHFVAGHVDGVGVVASVAPENGSLRLAVDAPSAIAGLIAVKGSVALDGVSLTVNAVTDLPGGGVRLAVNIIPHTGEATTLSGLKPGDRVNLEADLLARYAARLAGTARDGAADAGLHKGTWS